MKTNEYDGQTDEQLQDLEQWLYDCEVDGTDYYDQRLAIIDELERRKEMTPTDRALMLIRDELVKTCEKFPPMNSPHEGYATILEELDELWDHVKTNTGQSDDARKEAIQVAAMGLRYVLDLCELSQ